MIGSVSITYPPGTAIAVLDEGGQWQVTGTAVVAEHLRLCIDGLDYEYPGPSAGPFGPELLELVAARLTGAIVYLEPKIEQPAGTIY